MKPGLHTAAEGSAFAVTKAKPQEGKQSRVPQTPAQGARGGSPKKNSGHTSKCYNCGGQGHWAKNYPSPKKKRDSGQQKEMKKDTPSDQNRKRSGPPTAHGLFSAIEISMFLGKSPIMQCCFIVTAASGNFMPKIEDLHDFVPFPNPNPLQLQMVQKFN